MFVCTLTWPSECVTIASENISGTIQPTTKWRLLDCIANMFQWHSTKNLVVQPNDNVTHTTAQTLPLSKWWTDTDTLVAMKLKRQRRLPIGFRTSEIMMWTAQTANNYDINLISAFGTVCSGWYEWPTVLCAIQHSVVSNVSAQRFRLQVYSPATLLCIVCMSHN